MAPKSQEHQILLAKDASFDSILHRGTAGSKEGFAAVLQKDKEAHKAAVAEYFQHWDNKDAKDETEATRAVSAVFKEALRIYSTNMLPLNRLAQLTTPPVQRSQYL